MNYAMIRYVLSWVARVEAALLVLPLLIAVFYGEWQVFPVYAGTIVFCLAIGFLTAKKPKNTEIYAKDGFAAVALLWIVLSVFGALPFVFTGEIPFFVDALFEIVSGFTTTGSSILKNVEALSHASLFWRSFSHWTGGMGVLVFILMFIPVKTGSQMNLMRAESPGPDVSKFVPRVRGTAKILYRIYLAMTLAEIVLLLVTGMPWFDAVCISFGTAGTGGFGVKGDSFTSYSPYLQNVTTVFMLLFGVNFSCYYLLLLKRVKDVFCDEELRTYIAIVVISTLLIAWNISGLYNSLSEVLRHSAFQVATVISTTGYATTDFDQWPAFSKAILLLLMCCGASAGSTGGGIKVARLLLLFKSGRRSFHENLHPSEVRKVRMNGSVVDEKVMKSVNGYLIAYVMIIIVSFLAVSIDGFSVETNISAVLATFNNIGPGFQAVGPTCNFSAYSDFSKIVMIFDMLAGRLEILPIMVLFSKSTWKKN